MSSWVCLKEVRDVEHSRLEENHLQIIWETTDKPFSSMCNCEGLLIIPTESFSLSGDELRSTKQVQDFSRLNVSSSGCTKVLHLVTKSF